MKNHHTDWRKLINLYPALHFEPDFRKIVTELNTEEFVHIPTEKKQRSLSRY